MELALKPETEARLQQALKNGRFLDADQLIVTAMDALADSTPADIENLDQLIREGIESAENEPLYGEAEARAYLAEVRRGWK